MTTHALRGRNRVIAQELTGPSRTAPCGLPTRLTARTLPERRAVMMNPKRSMPQPADCQGDREESTEELALPDWL